MKSLKAYFLMVQGYPIIIPYRCPYYHLHSCFTFLYDKIQDTYNQISTNKYIGLSKIVLSRREEINIDECTNCFWVISINCIIKQCQINFKFDQQTNPLLQSISQQVLQLEESQFIKQNRFHKIIRKQTRENAQLPVYKYRAYTDSQLVYFSHKQIGSLYLTCSHFYQSYIYKIKPFVTIIVIIKNSINQRMNDKEHHKEVECQIRVNSLNVENSLIYHSNMFYQNIEAFKKYPTIVNSKYSGYYIYQYLDDQNQIVLKLSSCTSTPVTLMYYFLPNYETIKMRNKTEDEKDGLDDIENWISRKKVRVKSQWIQMKILKTNNLYFTNYLIIQLHSDSTSYIEFSVSFQGGSTDSDQIFMKSLVFAGQEYEEEWNGQISFKITLNLQNIEVNNKQFNKKIKIYQADSLDILELQFYCPTYLFFYPEFADLLPSILANFTITQYKNLQTKTFFCIQGISKMEYVGIYLHVNGTVYNQLIDMKTKISLMKKHLLIFVISGCCILLLMMGMVILIKTAPKFIIESSQEKKKKMKKTINNQNKIIDPIKQ